MVHFHLPFLVLPIFIRNSLQLNLLFTPNVSSIAQGRIPALNATRLTTYNDCFDTSEGHTFTATEPDCERALDTLVKGKSLVQVHHFGYEGRGLTDHLPVVAEYGSCIISLMTFDFEARITMTYAEIYSELLGPDGILKQCLGPKVPAADALGGLTSLGPSNKLIADVSGQPHKAANRKHR